MKRIVFITSMVICMQGSTQTGFKNTEFILEGLGLDLEGENIYLVYIDAKGKQRKDSSRVENGSFSFKGNIKEPTAAKLTNEENGEGNIENILYPIFLEPSKLSIIIKSGQIKSSKLQGSNVHDAYWYLEKSKAGIYAQLQALNMEMIDLKIEQIHQKGKDSAVVLIKIDSIQQAMQTLQQQVAVIDKKYFTRFPTSYVTYHQLQLYYDELTVTTLEEYYHKMYPAIKKGAYGKRLKEAIEKKRMPNSKEE